MSERSHLVRFAGRRLGYDDESQFVYNEVGWTFLSGHTYFTIFLLIWQMSEYALITIQAIFFIRFVKQARN